MSGFKLTGLHILLLTVAITADCRIDSANAAYAAPGRDPPSVRVSVKDLDLATKVGAAKLYWRIRNAARSVCGTVDTALPEEKAGWDRCVDEAIGRAVAKLGNANLTDYYLTKTHRAQLATTAQISKPGDRVR